MMLNCKGGSATQDRNISTDDMQEVSTFVDENHCIPGRENKLVTSTVIASKYARFIRANPNWKQQNIRKTMLEELFANVTIARCKRAKRMVMQKMLHSIEGEYSKVFNYQLELLKTNPGSIVAIKLDQYEMDSLQRFYMCFDACKKGFSLGVEKQ